MNSETSGRWAKGYVCRGFGCAAALALLGGCRDLDLQVLLSALDDPAPHTGGGSGGGAPTSGAGSPGTSCTASGPFEPVGFEPAPGSLAVEPDAGLRLVFSAPLDAAALAGAELRLSGAAGAPVAGDVSLDGCAIVFTPALRLPLATPHVLRLSGSVSGAHGAAWSGDIELAFRTRDGAWGEPELLTPDGDTPELALAADGSAVVAWQVPARAFDGGQVSARVALAERTEAAPSWQVVDFPRASGGPYSTPHRVLAGDDGSFEVLWHNTGYLYANVYRPGQGVGVLQRSAERGGNPDGDGAIAQGNTWLAANGFGWVTLWHTGDGSLWTRVGTPFPGQFDEVHPALAGPRLLADAAGNVQLFWAQASGVYTSTIGSESSPSDWSPPRAVVDRDPAIAGAFLAAGSSLGHALLAWEADEPAGGDAAASSARRLQLIQLTPDGDSNEARPERLETATDAASPALAMSATGDAALAWVERDGADESASARVWAAYRSRQASAWSDASALSSAARSRAPALALDPSGNGHALWLELDSAGAAQLVAARLSRDAAPGPATRISGAAPAAAEPRSPGHADPRLAVDAAGRAIAVWVTADGGIASARFE